MKNLLHAAYVHIDVGDLQSATDVLETLVEIDPMSVEAWVAYRQTCGTCEELDFLCERVLQIAGINRKERESFLDCYLRQKLGSCGLDVELQKIVTLELVDQFNFTLKDQSLVSINLEGCAKFKQGFAQFLGKVIFIPYIVLLALGLNLLSVGNNFGYWIIAVVALSVFVNIWKINFPVVKTNRKPSPHQSICPSMQKDEISYHPELIR